MNKRLVLLASVLTTAMVFLVIVTGCSKNSSPTAPYGAGGGGGGPTDVPFNSGTLTAPAGFDHAFPTAGTIGYHCTFHAGMGMVGTVVVAAGGAASATVTASGMTFSPSTVTIMPGGSVHWTIADGTHTVTSN
jgi:plastocyanin